MAIGLTIIELSEEAEVRYVKGARLEGFDSTGKEQMRLRLNLARELLGGVDSMARFSRWAVPNERLQHENDDNED